jgi:methionine synthase II (cobalamin-independent)
MSFFAYLLGGVFLIWALAPLFKKDSTWISLHMEGEELEDRKQRVYGNIADLEFDYAMGRLSEKDFNEIRRSFLSEAGKVMQQLEDQRSSKLVDTIKKDVEQLSKKGKKSKKAEAAKYCPDCGAKAKLNARFCTECGGALS